MRSARPRERSDIRIRMRDLRLCLLLVDKTLRDFLLHYIGGALCQLLLVLHQWLLFTEFEGILKKGGPVGVLIQSIGRFEILGLHGVVRHLLLVVQGVQLLIVVCTVAIPRRGLTRGQPFAL